MGRQLLWQLLKPSAWHFWLLRWDNYPPNPAVHHLITRYTVVSGSIVHHSHMQVWGTFIIMVSRGWLMNDIVKVMLCRQKDLTWCKYEIIKGMQVHVYLQYGCISSRLCKSNKKFLNTISFTGGKRCNNAPVGDELPNTLLFSWVQLLPSVKAQILTMVLYGFVDAMVWNAVVSLIGRVFGYVNFGKVLGLLLFLCGAIGLLNMPLDTWVVNGLDSRYWIVTTGQIILSAPLYVYCYVLWRREQQNIEINVITSPSIVIQWIARYQIKYREDQRWGHLCNSHLQHI